MSNSLLNESIQSQFSQLFEGIELTYRSVNVAAGIAHTFFVRHGNEQTIEQSWSRISNFIALNYQKSIPDDFGKWNTYLFVIVNAQINTDLKYKIENDTFSSRKIVVEGDSNHDEIVNKHILNNDLEITIERSKDNEPLLSRDFLWKLLEGKELKKQRKTGAAEPTFEELLKILKSSSDEI